MSNAAISSPVASFTVPSPLLQRSLLADALLSGLAGLALTFAAGPLATPLGLAVSLLRWSGLILIPFAAFVGWLGTRQRVHRPLVFAVVACNALWVVDSLLIMVVGWVEPTVLGEVVVIGQAAAVVVVAARELFGLRRSTFVEAHIRR